MVMSPARITAPKNALRKTIDALCATSPAMADAHKIEGAGWIRLLAGFAVLFAVLQGSAAALQSLHGEWGLVVAGAVLVTALLLQRALFAPTFRDAFRGLGLGPPRWRGVIAAALLCAALLLVYPAYLFMAGGFLTVTPNAAWLAIGLFMQAGIAEELAFRGYLYGAIRRGRTFWRAALLSILPFSFAHLYLFWTMAWPIALTALLLSVAISFPFARLYELAGRTIWAAALAHAVVQGAVKLLVIVYQNYFLMIWMAASAVLLWLVFLVPWKDDQAGSGSSPSMR
jgi:membrane protease YdiL (CAAX protease family)